MCLRPRGGEEKFLLKTEKKIEELQEDLSLSQFSMVEIWNSLEFLTRLQKDTPKGFI